MQLQDVLEAPQLRIRPVYLGEGALKRDVNWTFTTDLLDPRRYLTRGQLVMTGLVWRRDPKDSAVFVANVARAGAIALLAGEGLLGHIPDDVIEACREHDLPLLAVPSDVSFASITAFVSNTLAGDRVLRLNASLVRQRELLMEVYRGQMLEDLVTRTASELGRPVRVVTATGRHVAGAAHPIDDVDLDAIVEAVFASEQLPATLEDSSGEPLSVFVVAGAGEHRATAWYLVVSGDWNEWDPSLLEASHELASLVGLYRAQRAGDAYGVSEIGGRLIELIAADDEQPEVDVYRRQAGIGDDDEVFVVAAGFEGRPDLQDLAMWLVMDAVSHIGPPVVGVDGPERVVALVPSTLGEESSIPGASPVAVLSRALRRAAIGVKEDGPLRIGISNPAAAPRLGGALRSARYGLTLPNEAQQDGEAIVISGGGRMVSAVQLLSTVPDELRRVFGELLLGPLREHDARHQSQLIPTLEVFLDCDGSWVRTAERTHLHLNTVRYRIAKAETLTGRDLSRTADRADFHLALRLR